jgi:hypothetical protein
MPEVPLSGVGIRRDSRAGQLGDPRFSGALGRIHPAAGSWSIRRLAIYPSYGGIVIHPGQCRRLSPRWPRGEAQIVRLVTEPPMGGLIEKHTGCHVATTLLADGRVCFGRWTVPSPSAMVVPAPQRATVTRDPPGGVRPVRLAVGGPALLVSDRWPSWGCDLLSQLLDAVRCDVASTWRQGPPVGRRMGTTVEVSMSLPSESVSGMRTLCPRFGYSSYPRRECELGEQPGTCRPRTCLGGAARSNAAVIAIATLRRPSVGGRWRSPERPNETPP